jgi:4-amino-4-deoxy-L-arabinose transferase-like glycosyltransferase
LLGRVARLDRVLLLTVTLAACVRFWRLGAQALWFDEFVTTQVVSRPLGDLLSAVAHREGSPPLYFLATWGWTHLFGDSDVAIRSLSAVVGTATVPVMYALSSCVVGTRRSARVAALLMAVSPMAVWYSQEARAYALLLFLGALSLLFLARAIESRATSYLLAWGCVSAAAVLTHYFAVVLVITEVAWLVFASRARWRGLVRSMSIASVPFLLVLTPLLVLALGQRATDQQAWIDKFPRPLRLAEAGRHFALGPGEPDDRLLIVSALCVVVAVTIVVVRGTDRERRGAAVMAGIGLAGVGLPLLAGVVGADYFIGRNVIASLAPLLVAVAAGLGARRAGVPGIVAIVGAAALSLGVVVSVGTNLDLEKPNWRALGTAIDARALPGAVIVQDYLGTPLLRYVRGSRLLRDGDSFDGRRIDVVYHVPSFRRRCGRWSGRACEFFYFPRFPEQVISRFTLTDKISVAGFLVNRYESGVPVRLSARELLGDRLPGGLVVFSRGARGSTT